MVEGFSTIWGLEDTTFIAFEAICVNTNRNGALIESWLHLAISFGKIFVSTHTCNSLGFIVLAFAIFSIVGIVWLLLNLVLFKIFEGSIHETSIASMIALVCWAVNQLLLRKGGELVSVNLVSTFNWSSSWESPAWSTWSLVLDTSDSTFGYPVNWRLEILLREVDFVTDLVVIGSQAEVEVSELLIGKVWELVKSFLVWDIIAGVVDSGLDFTRFPLPESEAVLFIAEVILVVVEHPSHEFLLVLSDDSRRWAEAGLGGTEADVADGSHNGDESNEGENDADFALALRCAYKEAVFHFDKFFQERAHLKPLLAPSQPYISWPPYPLLIPYTIWQSTPLSNINNNFNQDFNSLPPLTLPPSIFSLLVPCFLISFSSSFKSLIWSKDHSILSSFSFSLQCLYLALIDSLRIHVWSSASIH